MPTLSVQGRQPPELIRGHLNDRPVPAIRCCDNPTCFGRRRQTAAGPGKVVPPGTSTRLDGLRGVIEVPAAAHDDLGRKPDHDGAAAGFYPTLICGIHGDHPKCPYKLFA
jgi:hypothetical protein